MSEPELFDKRTCTYDWGDGDFCNMPLGHEGNHDVFGPKCGVRMPGTMLTCKGEWNHSGKHRTEAWW